MHNVELLRIVRIRRKRLYDIMISVEVRQFGAKYITGGNPVW